MERPPPATKPRSAECRMTASWNRQSPGLRFIKDRRHVAGFETHRFSRVPAPANRWKVQTLELVSLLLHDEPEVYVSTHLPRMERRHGQPTRPLDRFERSVWTPWAKARTCSLPSLMRVCVCSVRFAVTVVASTATAVKGEICWGRSPTRCSPMGRECRWGDRWHTLIATILGTRYEKLAVNNVAFRMVAAIEKGLRLLGFSDGA